MAGIDLEQFRLKLPVLVELRWELNKVAVHIGARVALVLAAGEHAVESVAKLVEHCFHFVDGEQRSLASGRLGEVAHVVDYRTLALGAVGFLEHKHPRALAFALARIVVGHESGDVLAFNVGHVVDLNVWMIDWCVGNLLECQSVKAVGHREDALAHVVDREICAHIVFVEVELLLFHLLGIVVIVPSSDFEVAAVVVDIRLHISDFLFRFLHCWLPNLHQQILSSLHCLRHHVGCLEVGIGLVAEDVGFSLAQAQDCGNLLLVVVLVAVVGEVDVALVHLLAKCAVVGVGEERQAAWRTQCKHPFPFQSGSLSLVGSLSDARCRKTREVALVVNNHAPLVGVVHDVVAKLEVGCSQLLVDFLQFFLLLGREQSAAAHHLLVVFVEQTFLWLGEVKLLAIVVDLLHAVKQALVHHHLVAVLGEHRKHLLAERLEFGRRDGFVKAVEHVRHVFEQLSGIVECHDSVVEVGQCAVVDNCFNLLVVLADAFLEGWQIVVVGDFLKRRHVVGCAIRRQKWIFGFHFSCG